MEEKFKLEFTFAEINLILKALRKLPYEESVVVINGTIKQYETELKKKEAKAIKEKK